MPLLEWDKSYAIDVKELDDDHKVLVEMLNKAFDASEVEGKTESLPLLVAEMRAYAEMHFHKEEELMAALSYPDKEAHAGMHKIFRDRAQEFAQAGENWKMSDTIDLLTFLADWLKVHILGTDRKLGTFLKNKGVE